MPLYNWEKIKETNNLYYLTKKSTKDFTGKRNMFTSSLKNRWNNIQDEKNDIFGITEDMAKLLKKLNEYRKNMEEYLITGDRALKVWISINKEEIKELTRKGDGIDTYEALEMMSEKYGNIDYNKITVFEFYNKIKVFNKRVS